MRCHRTSDNHLVSREIIKKHFMNRIVQMGQIWFPYRLRYICKYYIVYCVLLLNCVPLFHGSTPALLTNKIACIPVISRLVRIYSKFLNLCIIFRCWDEIPINYDCPLTFLMCWNTWEIYYIIFLYFHSLYCFFLPQPCDVYLFRFFYRSWSKTKVITKFYMYCEF